MNGRLQGFDALDAHRHHRLGQIGQFAQDDLDIRQAVEIAPGDAQHGALAKTAQTGHHRRVLRFAPGVRLPVENRLQFGLQTLAVAGQGFRLVDAFIQHGDKAKRLTQALTGDEITAGPGAGQRLPVDGIGIQRLARAGFTPVLPVIVEQRLQTGGKGGHGIVARLAARIMTQAASSLMMR